MNARYNIQWTRVAESDLRAIIDYIAEVSVANAASIFEKIRERASHLHRFPERGRVVPELADQGITLYRELVVAPWRIVYRISDKRVYVLSVLDARRNVEDLLLKRFMYRTP